MSVEIKVPVLPESVSDASLAKWHKAVGEFVKAGESLVDLETDKVMLEVPAPEDGIVLELCKPEGAVVLENELLALLTAQKAVPEAPEAPAATSVETKDTAHASAPSTESEASTLTLLSPSVRRLVSEHNIDLDNIQGSGKAGRVLKSDVMAWVNQSSKLVSSAESVAPVPPHAQARREQRVPMSRLRARIADRLLTVQQNAAILTTFNEVNMQAVMDLRARYQDAFEKEHGVRLGFMSFFVRAAVAALKKFPTVNASIDGQDIVYHGYFDLGVAIASPRGLVVPIIRDADTLTMAGIEQSIKDYANRAKDGKLTIEEMTGGTFTITNGGVFGSLLSTPILNPPQSAILGMHKIEKKPVVEGDQIVVRPMMYLALSYDHRIIDGSESVRFLVTIKSLLEDPSRLLLDL